MQNLQPRCPSVGQWIKFTVGIQMTEYTNILKEMSYQSHEKTSGGTLNI